MLTRHPLLRILVFGSGLAGLCTSGSALFTVCAVPREVADCDDGEWYHIDRTRDETGLPQDVLLERSR